MLAPELICRRALLVSFGYIECAYTQSDDEIGRFSRVNYGPTAGPDTQVDAQDQVVSNICICHLISPARGIPMKLSTGDIDIRLHHSQ